MRTKSLVLPPGNVTTVKPVGPFCICGWEGRVRNAIAALLRQGDRTFLLNLAACEFVGSGDLGEMVRARRQVVDTGGRFGLCVLHPRIKQLMEVTKLSREFDIFDTEDEGVRNFEATAQA